MRVLTMQLPAEGHSSIKRASRFGGRLSLALLSVLSVACTGETSAYETDADSGSVHAAVRVQNVTAPDGSSRGDALAGFVRVPADADAGQVLALAGLDLQFPEKGECYSEAELSGLTSLTDAELLEAREVVLESDESVFELAPYAFPGVADLLRGAVYLSRDRDTALPAGSRYTLLGSGIEGESGDIGLTTTQQSPPAFGAVTVDGEELSGTLELSPRRVLDLSWESAESSTDLVVVTVENEDEFWACSFSDAEEFGSVPLLTDAGAELGQSGRESLVTVHRVRSVEELGQDGVDEVHVTFDFAVQASVVFGDNDNSQ